MGELRLVSEASIRRAHQRLASMAGLRREEALVAFPGEVPSLLRDALALAESTNYMRDQLAAELCWSDAHLSAMLGDVDTRPRLTVVREPTA